MKKIITKFSLILILSFISLLADELKTENIKVDSIDNKEIHELSKTVVSATAMPEESFYLSRTVSQVSADDLDKYHSQSLSDALEKLPGIQMSTQGNNVAKPVIRGMTNQRVVTVRDGMRHEAQQWSAHHTPEIDVNDAENIEVLRGPAGLLYGSGALGGVVVVNSPSVKTTLQNAVPFGVDASWTIFSNSMQNAGYLATHGAWKNGMWRVDFSGRNSEYFAVPGENNFLVKQAANTVSDTVETEYPGFKQYNIRAIGGIKIKSYETSVALTQYDEEQTLIGEGHWHNSGGPDGGPWYHAGEALISPTLHQKVQWNNKLYRDDSEIQGNVAFQHDHRQGGTESAGVQVDLENYYFTGNLRMNYDKNPKLPGVIGFESGYKRDRTHGVEVLIPNYDTKDAGIFLLQEFRPSDRWRFSAGARGDFRSYLIHETQMTDGFDPAASLVLRGQEMSLIPTMTIEGKDNMLAPAFGLGSSWNAPQLPFSVALNLASGFRYPDPNELAILGAHHGSYEYLVGLAISDPTATNVKITDINQYQEKSYSLDLIFRWQGKKIQSELSGYYNRFHNYIYTSPTGEFMWLSAISALPVKEYVQSNVQMYGMEFSTNYNLTSWLNMKTGYDFVIGEILDDVEDTDGDGEVEPWLPQISPPRILGSFEFILPSRNKIKSHSFSMGSSVFFAQSRLAEFENIIRIDSDGNNEEFTSESYVLFNLGYDIELLVRKNILRMSMKIDNLLNTEYTSHLNNYKGIAENPGFDLSFKTSFHF